MTFCLGTKSQHRPSLAWTGPQKQFSVLRKLFFRFQNISIIISIENSLVLKSEVQMILQICMDFHSENFRRIQIIMLTWRVGLMHLGSQWCGSERWGTQICLWASHLPWTLLPIWPNPTPEVKPHRQPQCLLCRSWTWELSSEWCFPSQLYHRTPPALMISNKNWCLCENFAPVPSQTLPGTASDLHRFPQTLRTPISVQRLDNN